MLIGPYAVPPITRGRKDWRSRRERTWVQSAYCTRLYLHRSDVSPNPRDIGPLRGVEGKDNRPRSVNGYPSNSRERPGSFAAGVRGGAGFDS